MKKKVIFFLPNNLGGVFTYVNNYRILIQDEIRIQKVISYKALPILKNQIIIENNEHYKIHYSQFSKEKAILSLLKAHVENDCLLICNDALELEMINKYKLKNKVFFILHGDLQHYHTILAKHSNIIDIVIAVSTGLKNKYQKLYPEIPFNVASPPVLNIKSSNSLKVDTQIKCIYIGRFEHTKGSDLFTEIVQQIHGKYPEVKFQAVCPKPIADKLSFNTINTFVEFRFDLSHNEVLHELNNADILIFMSRTEGFGLVVLEALSQGVVPVALKIPIGIPDQIIHSHNGYMVDSVEEAVVAIESLITNPDKLTTLKKNAIAFVHENFHPEQMADNFLKIISQQVKTRSKIFFKTKEPYLERIIPSFIYKVLKKINYKVRYAG